VKLSKGKSKRHPPNKRQEFWKTKSGKLRLPNTPFTKRNVDLILAMRKVLTPEKFICKAVGITQKMLDKWKKGNYRVMWEMEVAKTPEGEAVMGRPFFHAIYEKAEGEGVAFCLGQIMDSASGVKSGNRAKNWQAASWLLERTFPEYFSRVTVTKDGPRNEVGAPVVPQEGQEALGTLPPVALRNLMNVVKDGKKELRKLHKDKLQTLGKTGDKCG
jgi:hypothetical protein